MPPPTARGDPKVKVNGPEHHPNQRLEVAPWQIAGIWQLVLCAPTFGYTPLMQYGWWSKSNRIERTSINAMVNLWYVARNLCGSRGLLVNHNFSHQRPKKPGDQTIGWNNETVKRMPWSPLSSHQICLESRPSLCCNHEDDVAEGIQHQNQKSHACTGS